MYMYSSFVIKCKQQMILHTKETFPFPLIPPGKCWDRLWQTSPCRPPAVRTSPDR